MARIFSINFSFNDEHYHTMVAVQTAPLFIEYTLLNLDFDLAPLLPGNKIISTSPGQFLFLNATPQNSTALMNKITRAVAMHLEAINQ